MDNSQRPLVGDLAPSTNSPSFPPALEDRGKRSALRIVFLVVAIDLLGFAIVLPLLPRIAKSFLEGGEANRWKGPVIGALMASFSAAQFVFMPVWGRISDRVGRRPILLLGLLSSVVFYTLFGFGCMLGTEGLRLVALWLMFASRIGAGVSGATLGVAQAAIADCTSDQERARGMALIGAAFGIGFFFGPIIGSLGMLVAPDFLGGPGFVAAGLSLIALALGVVQLPETRRFGAPSTVRRHWFNRHGWQTALSTPGVGVLILTFFLATLAFANFEPTLPLITQTRGLNLSDRDNFLIFAYVGLVLALAQGGLYRPLARRLPEKRFMEIGTVLMMVGLAGIGAVAALADRPEPLAFGTLLAWLMIVLAVAVTGFAFVTPSVQSLISRTSDPTRQGEILGVNQSCSAMARILGPALGPTFFFLTAAHVIPYMMGAGLLGVVLILVLGIRQPAPR